MLFKVPLGNSHELINFYKQGKFTAVKLDEAIKSCKK